MQAERDGRRNGEIFLISFAMLFLEIAFIRWISTEIRIFSYFNNLVILACFLGIGTGCYFSGQKPRLWTSLILISVIIALVHAPLAVVYKGHTVHLFRDTPALLGAFADSVVWYETGSKTLFLSIAIGLLSTFVIFFALFFIFIPLGQILGRALNEHRNALVAYSVNIGASLLGIWAFSAASLILAPPWAWFAFFLALAVLMAALFEERPMKSLLAILVSLLVVFFAMVLPAERPGSATVWSPYQKLEIRPLPYGIDSTGYQIRVNNVSYMFLFSMAKSALAADRPADRDAMRTYNQYDLPYLFKDNVKNVLIVGSGGGNDVAAALRHGVFRVDALEIDPVIYATGLRLHPERPYSDPRVTVTVDDARSAFKKLRKGYDIISFGLLDSHVASSNFTNMRLDHYVYTEESFREAKALLAENGVLTVSFQVDTAWIGQRILDTLTKVFGTPPSTLFIKDGAGGYGGTMFVAGDPAESARRIRNDPVLSSYAQASRALTTTPGSVALTSDDWPYLYIRNRHIPKMHLSVIAILSVLFLFFRRSMRAHGHRIDLHFFFLGAAFLLLEFQNISKASLLFGSTWMVNTFTISAILALALAANAVVSIFRIKDIRPFYAALFLYILMLFAVPLAAFNNLAYWQKLIFGSIYLNLPMFFSGIIFATSFSRTRTKDAAFGSNILGAAAGGLSETLSFIFGIRILLLFALAFYALSLFFLREET